MKTHEEIEGYVLFSNYSPMGMLSSGTEPRLHTLESLTEHIQKRWPMIPLEAVRITRNEIVGGWSVYVRQDYGYLADDLKRGVQDLLDMFKRAHGL